MIVHGSRSGSAEDITKALRNTRSFTRSSVRIMKKGAKMTVKELVELNQNIVDIEIEVRKNGGLLVDALEIGPERGQVPPCPKKIPESENYAGNPTRVRLANYIEKSINAWDDGHDYYQVKPDRIPKKWQDLEVYAWDVWPASLFGNPRRRSGNARNVNFHGERLNITALPSGDTLEIPQPKQEKEQDPDNQMNLFDYMRGDT